MAKYLRAVVDDGTREVPILNKFGKEICKIYFRPADYSILDRLEKVGERLKAKLAALSDLELTNTGEAVHEKDTAALKEAEKIVYDEFNYLFDMEEANLIFAKRSAFSSIGGHFFCLVVLDALGDVITDAVKEEAALAQKRMAKYMDDVPDEVIADAGTTPEST